MYAIRSYYDKYSGDNFSLVLNSVHKSYSGVVNEIYYGDKTILLLKIAKDYRAGFISGFLILILGITLVIFSILTFFSENKYKNLYYLGIFNILISFWIFGESRMIQFFRNNFV